MSIPSSLNKNLTLPLIVSPMFLVSGPDLVVATCKAGVIGTFPALNTRPIEMLETWMQEIKDHLAGEESAAPWGVNLIVHGSNARLAEEIEIVRKMQPPLVITSVGQPKEIVDIVHEYGGVVFHDIINMRHARSAMRAGVDGLIAVCAGAGGHAGLMNPMTLIPQLRAEFDGTIILAGAMSDGTSIRAAEVLGADMAYMGTRFIACEESMADDHYKDMLISEASADIVYTNKVSGIWGNFLSKSLEEAGVNPETGEAKDPDFNANTKNKRGGGTKNAWKVILSAGQGVGQISDSPKTSEIVDRMKADYKKASAVPVNFG